VRVHTEQGWVGELAGVRVAQGPIALVVNLGPGLACTLWAVHERNGANDKGAARARSINDCLSLAVWHASSHRCEDALEFHLRAS
jgi:hypothetical protein